MVKNYNNRVNDGLFCNISAVLYCQLYWYRILRTSPSSTPSSCTYAYIVQATGSRVLLEQLLEKEQGAVIDNPARSHEV